MTESEPNESAAADDPALQSRIRELRRELEAAGDRLDLDAPRWAAYAGRAAAGDG